MSYRVHRLKINPDRDQAKLEQFLNDLSGDVVSIIPNNSRMSLAQIYGLTNKINSLLIVEKVR